MNLSEIPPTIFVAAGAILAASVSGAISFVNLIISKDQKVSEFRQEWINKLREDIATYLGHIHAISVTWQGVVLSKKEDRVDGNDLKYFIEKVQEDLRISFKAYTRIVLRLNPIEHKILIDKLDEINEKLSKPDELKDVDLLDNLFVEATNISHRFLRKEWKRVKRGEMSYVCTKYSALLIFVIILVSSCFYGQKFYKKTSTENSSNKSIKQTGGNAGIIYLIQ